MKPGIYAASIALLVGSIWYWYTRPVVNAQRLAPPGVYFLVQRLSLTTDHGIIALSEGTRVRLIRENGSTMRVTTGTDEFEVERDTLTNDLDIAEAVARRDAAGRLKFEQWRRGQKALQAKHRQLEALEIERTEEMRRRRALPPIGSTPGPLDRGPYHRK